MKHVDAVDVAADDARSKPVVSYSWTADGEPERCRVEGRDYAGEECYHCRRPVEGRSVRLRAADGGEYDLHAECAREGCAARDAAVLDAVLGSFGSRPEAR